MVKQSSEQLQKGRRWLPTTCKNLSPIMAPTVRRSGKVMIAARGSSINVCKLQTKSAAMRSHHRRKLRGTDALSKTLYFRYPALFNPEMYLDMSENVHASTQTNNYFTHMRMTTF